VYAQPAAYQVVLSCIRLADWLVGWLVNSFVGYLFI
jgi:hypothetical protein